MQVILRLLIFAKFIKLTKIYASLFSQKKNFLNLSNIFEQFPSKTGIQDFFQLLIF